MTNCNLIDSRRLVVAMDYGQFYLTGTGGELPTEISALVDRSITEGGISASDDNQVLVLLSPHQNNFEMRLLIERWDGLPDLDLDEWEEAFSASLIVDGAGLTFESPTMDSHDLGTPPGTYDLVITGKGFVASGWPGSTQPGDEWRIRLWPTHGVRSPKRLAAWSAL